MLFFLHIFLLLVIVPKFTAVYFFLAHLKFMWCVSLISVQLSLSFSLLILSLSLYLHFLDMLWILQRCKVKPTFQPRYVLLPLASELCTCGIFFAMIFFLLVLN